MKYKNKTENNKKIVAEIFTFSNRKKKKNSLRETQEVLHLKFFPFLFKITITEKLRTKKLQQTEIQNIRMKQQKIK